MSVFPQLSTLNSVWPAVSLSMYWQLKKNTTANGSDDLQPEIQIIYTHMYMYTEANAPGSIESDCRRAAWKLDREEMQFLAQSMNIG